jgi:hypothetical protein
MLTVGHTQIDAVLATYRTILAETIDSLAGAQGQVAVLTADLAAANASLEAAQKDVVQRDARINELTADDAKSAPVTVVDESPTMRNA